MGTKSPISGLSTSAFRVATQKWKGKTTVPASGRKEGEHAPPHVSLEVKKVEFKVKVKVRVI